jgi:alanine racemase
MATITLNKENFFYNLNQIALKTGSVDKVAVVLKDNAYGHGLELMAGLAHEFGIQHAVVKNIQEAKAIRYLFKTVLVLNDEIVADEVISFAINTLSDISHAQEGARVELKVDTGMHRNGISMHEVNSALTQIEKKGLKLVGVMTHFRAADVLSSELFWQKKNFERVKEKVKNKGFKNVRFHSHNSAAILRSKIFNEDIVRAGIAIYGYNELPAIYDEIKLKPVLTLHAKRTATRELKKSQRVGYAGDFTAPNDMTVSTYDLGYGDGWTRTVNENAYVTPEGLPLLGRVSMDFVTLESKKEEVVILDNAQKAAKHFGTISYEVTTGLSKDIERVIV